MKKLVCCCGAELNGSHDHVTCGPPVEIEADPLIEKIRQALEETSGHLYTETDSARCRELSRRTIPILDTLSAEIDRLRFQIAKPRVCDSEEINRLADLVRTLSRLLIKMGVEVPR